MHYKTSERMRNNNLKTFHNNYQYFYIVCIEMLSWQQDDGHLDMGYTQEEAVAEVESSSSTNSSALLQ